MEPRSSHLKAKELFLDALHVAVDDREAFLAASCGDDTALLAEVRALLAFHHESASAGATPVAPDPSWEGFVPGDIVAGRYRMIALLGRGGMGQVWRADDLVLDTPVALKFLRSASDHGRVQVLNEVRLARLITHPAVCRVFDVGEAGGDVFFSMEFIDGEDLSALIKQVGRLPSEKVIDIAHQLCGGLGAAHAQGVLHRDLKPANILIDDSGLVRITDFGIAVSNTASGPQIMAGTPGYMAPEQRTTPGGQASVQSDVYALGLVLFELVTGRHAFAGSKESGERPSNPTRPSQLVPGVDLKLDAAITAALSVEPRDRPASATAMQALLPGGEVPVGVRERVRRRAAWRSPWWLSIVATGVGVILLAVAASVFISGGARALTDQDTIILADFVNRTGDPVFDGTLEQALAIALEQSPFLRILSDERVQETLRLMGRPSSAPVTSEVAREVAQREGLKALLTGSISSLGRNFVVSVEAQNAATGEVMARELVEAEGKERVLSALGSATSRLRERLGESLASIQRFNTPPERATTASLEALKAYSTAMELSRGAPSIDAIPPLRRAIELDPDFALAYAQLSGVYVNTRQPGLAPPLSEKAFALRDRVSERERFLISWRYYRDVKQDWDKALELARAWSVAYPRDAGALNSVGLALLETSRPEQALEIFTQARRVDPTFLTPYLNLGTTLTALGRYEEAKEPLRYAADHGGTGATLQRYFYGIAFVQNDMDTMLKLEAENATSSENYAAFNWRARRQGFLGQMRSSHETYRDGVSTATVRGLAGPAAQMETEDAEYHALVGQCDDARRETAAAIAFSRDNLTLERASRALAWCGAFDQVDALTAELRTRFPEATLTVRRWLPITEAIAAWRRGNSARTLDILEEVRPLESGSMLWPAYLRAHAFLRLREFANAREQFEYILDHRGQSVFSSLYPLAYLGLARVEAEDGNMARARETYDRFLTIWKDADANLPAMVEARRERAALQ